MCRGLGSETLLRWHRSPVRPWVAVATLVTGKLQTFSRWGSYLHAATISAASLRRGRHHRVPLRRTCCTPLPRASFFIGRRFAATSRHDTRDSGLRELGLLDLYPGGGPGPCSPTGGGGGRHGLLHPLREIMLRDGFRRRGKTVHPCCSRAGLLLCKLLVDDIVEEFTKINRIMEKTDDCTMKRKKLFQLMGKANSNLADVIIRFGRQVINCLEKCNIDARLRRRLWLVMEIVLYAVGGGCTAEACTLDLDIAVFNKEEVSLAGHDQYMVAGRRAEPLPTAPRGVKPYVLIGWVSQD